MKLYLSFEQEAMVAECGDESHKNLRLNARQDKLDTGFVTIADAELYDGPGAKAPPGNILAYVGPIEDKFAGEAVRQQANLLRSLGHEVLVCGEDY